MKLIPSKTTVRNIRSSNIRIKYIPLFESFIKLASEGKIITVNGDIYSKGTIRSYRATLHYLKKFEYEFNSKIYCDQINVFWAEEFQIFLKDKNLSKNTIKSNMNRIKTVLNRAFYAGLAPFSAKGISLRGEKNPSMYFTLNELKHLKNYKLSSPSRAYARDIFIMQCFLGMRVGDYFEFLKDPKKYIVKENDNDYVDFYSEKTKKRSVVPVSEVVRTTLGTYNYQFFSMATWSYNEILKASLKEAGMNALVPKRITKGGVLNATMKPKHELVSSHTARRTFASILEVEGLERQMIMKMTGHSTEQSYLSYVQVTEWESAREAKKHPFFNMLI